MGKMSILILINFSTYTTINVFWGFKAFLITSVCRRPVVQNAGPVPDNWDKTQIPETGYSVL